jgi:hypothetical protein
MIKARNQTARLQNHVSALTTERDQLQRQLQQSIVDRQTMGIQLSARDAQIEKLSGERDGLAKRHEEARVNHEVAMANRRQKLEELEEERTKASVELSNLTIQFKSLKPLIDWAQDLVERERGQQPIVIDREWVWIHQPETLRNNEAKFELRIGFQYFGVHRLIVGEQYSGSLARFNGEEYNQDVKVTFDHEKEYEAYARVGHTSGTLCLTQKVSRESADELLALMGANVPQGRINVGVKRVMVSVRVVARHNDESLFEGRFPLGEEIEARYTLRA